MDTISNTPLPADLQPLAERLAKHVHDSWAALRRSQGWSYGPVRDDAARKHPCLVPYDELPEEEKEFDRNTSCETIRFILSHGFRIVKTE